MAKPNTGGTPFKKPGPANIPPKPGVPKTVNKTAKATATAGTRQPTNRQRPGAPHGAGSTAGKVNARPAVSHKPKPTAQTTSAKAGTTKTRTRTSGAAALLSAATIAQIKKLVKALPAATATASATAPAAASAAPAAPAAGAPAPAAATAAAQPAAAAVPAAQTPTKWTGKMKIMGAILSLLIIGLAVFLLWPVLPQSHKDVVLTPASPAQQTADWATCPPGSFIAGTTAGTDNSTGGSPSSTAAKIDAVPAPTSYVDVPALSYASQGVNLNIGGISQNQSVGVSITGGSNVFNSPLVLIQNEFGQSKTNVQSKVVTKPQPTQTSPPVSYAPQQQMMPAPGPEPVYFAQAYQNPVCYGPGYGATRAIRSPARIGVQIRVNPFGSPIGHHYQSFSPGPGSPGFGGRNRW